VSGDSALTTRPREGAAGLFMDVMKQVFGTEPPLRLRASGGSEGGPPDKPVVILRSPQALRRMMWHPGELGLAQAYVTGELDVDGYVAEGLRAVWRTARYRGLADARLPAAAWGAAVRAAIMLGVPGPKPLPPATQAVVGRGRRDGIEARAVVGPLEDQPQRDPGHGEKENCSQGKIQPDPAHVMSPPLTARRSGSPRHVLEPVRKPYAAGRRACCATGGRLSVLCWWRASRRVMMMIMDQ
jgi:hypothetical protein